MAGSGSVGVCVVCVLRMAGTWRMVAQVLFQANCQCKCCNNQLQAAVVATTKCGPMAAVQTATTRATKRVPVPVPVAKYLLMTSKSTNAHRHTPSNFCLQLPRHFPHAKQTSQLTATQFCSGKATQPKLPQRRFLVAVLRFAEARAV